MTDANARIVRKGFEGRTPRTAADFAETFAMSELGKQNLEDMQAYRGEFIGQPEVKKRYSMSAVAERAKTQKKRSPYVISIPMQARAVMERRLRILRGNFATEAIQIIVFILQAIINGTVFLQVPDSTSAYFSRGGVLFL